MKKLYTILFFLDTLALIRFTYLFLKLADWGTSEFMYMAILFGIVVCIALLVYITDGFLKQSVSKKQHFFD